MNKDRRTYAPQDEDDFSDVCENPYACPKGRDIESLLDRADYLRDEQKDREWEEAMEATRLRKEKEASTNTRP